MKSGEETREGEIYEEIVVVLQEFDLERKALRVILRGKQWLTVYRAHQVVLQLVCQTRVIFGHTNGNISESVSSFYTGPFFLGRLGYELSRNGFVVSVYAL